MLACIFFLYPTHNSRVTPLGAVYLVWQHSEGSPAERRQSRVEMMSACFNQINHCCKRHIWSSAGADKSVRDNNKVLMSNINPDPALLWSNVLNSMTRTCSLFLFSFWNFTSVFICFIMSTLVEWCRPSATFCATDAAEIQPDIIETWHNHIIMQSLHYQVMKWSRCP